MVIGNSARTRWIAAAAFIGILTGGVGWAESPSERWLKKSPLPEWIWHDGGASSGQRIFLLKTFELPGAVESSTFYATCDNRMKLWVNGHEVANSNDWSDPATPEVTKLLRPGQNVIAVAAQNDGGVAAFLCKLTATQEGGRTEVVISDSSWRVSLESPDDGWFQLGYDASGWTGEVSSLDRLGGGPWGIPGFGGGGNRSAALAANEISVPPGFEVDQIYSVPRESEGSWVALTVGPQGQLVACDQGDRGAFLIQVSDSDDGPTAQVTPIAVKQPGTDRRLSGAQGLLWAFDALWFHKNGGHLYRITDSDGDGTFDHAEQLPSQTGGGEHGNHALIKTPDGEAIYMAGGNHAPLAELASSRVPTWDEDLLLPRMWDANGHARGRLAPGGWVTRLDPRTGQQELRCIGFRNQYDIALNGHGDLFTYDADMEWDLGMPWYRPTRICLVASGADYGWRSGTGKWPTYYEDSLPPVVEIGPGSPTGVVSGTGTRFPPRYQQAIFALDWTFGTIYAIHLRPEGAGYTAVSEPFATGSPLPVTDAVVGEDGHLYFTVGGRGTQSALYRIRYNGDAAAAAVVDGSLPMEVREARRIRDRLESYHGRPLSGEAADKALADAWSHLNSGDRFLRHAARIAIESQPVDRWASRALNESDPQASVTAAVALARRGNASHQPELLDHLLAIDPKPLTDSQVLGWLRAFSLTLIRLAEPNESQRRRLIEKLDPLLPDGNDDINTELVRLLVYLKSPHVIEKTLTLIRERRPAPIPDWSELASRNAGYGGTVRRVLENHPPSREIGYAFMLRSIRDGWTLDQRREYFTFLNHAAERSGGASFPGFMRNIRDEALSLCSDAERVALQDVTGETYDPIPDFKIGPIAGPGKAWTAAQAHAEAAQRMNQASFENGRSLYFAVDCGKCHRFSGLGGNIGPDLTTIPRKFDVGYVIEHIIEPSKVISDQYQSSTVVTESGQVLTGLVSEADGKIIIYPADVDADPIELASDQVDQIKPSPVSQMPKGLIDRLNADELRDLLAYLMSGGDPNNTKVYGRR